MLKGVGTSAQNRPDHNGGSKQEKCEPRAREVVAFGVDAGLQRSQIRIGRTVAYRYARARWVSLENRLRPILAAGFDELPEVAHVGEITRSFHFILICQGCTLHRELSCTAFAILYDPPGGFLLRVDDDAVCGWPALARVRVPQVSQTGRKYRDSE